VTATAVTKRSTSSAAAAAGAPTEKTPIRMLHDRVLVALDREPGERKSSGGILIPATAAMGGKRLAWCRVVGVGSMVRSVQVDDRVLFDPEDKAEVEVSGEMYVVIRERDIHAVAADRLGDSPTGLYL
jgi:chaperonin GroES